MRLWSIHPKYLDCKGLVALWREALLSKKILQGKTRGYTSHPQLIRFKQHKNPIRLINTYLFYIWREAKERHYRFNKFKIGKTTRDKIKVNKGQIEYEFRQLKRRLRTRNKLAYRKLLKVKRIEVHPLFILREGPVEQWEKVKHLPQEE
ncbi:MAG: pyrimidine dimer DNA glycosylase/endonuclease V [Candidatus Bilamarchaeaceae archaeon]